MTSYIIYFHGRERGSVGVRYAMMGIASGDSEQAALAKLEARYTDLTRVRISLLGEHTQNRAPTIL